VENPAKHVLARREPGVFDGVAAHMLHLFISRLPDGRSASTGLA